MTETQREELIKKGNYGVLIHSDGTLRPFKKPRGMGNYSPKIKKLNKADKGSKIVIL
jgi:hypothetical protein